VNREIAAPAQFRVAKKRPLAEKRCGARD